MSTVPGSEFQVPASKVFQVPNARRQVQERYSERKPGTRHPAPFGLYIHIPFCASRCHYCDFNTYRFDGAQADLYLEALAREIDVRAAMPPLRDRPVCSVFFGGGTPSILEAEQVVGLLRRCRAAFAFDDGAEITLEANPGTVGLPKLRAMREDGVTRVSFGAQAAQDRLLQRIGRAHVVDEAEQAFYAAREAGFRNINLDLMFGLPGQGLGDWAETLEWATRLDPEHISAYGLILEEGTRLFREHCAGALEMPDEETEAAMYQMTLDRLADAGFEQYEISNFARPGFRCRHNLVYWEHREYLGLGAGAHSFLDGQRFHNELLPAAYVRALRERGTAVAGGEMVSPDLRRSERLMLGLRMRAGLDLQTVRELLGVEDPAASDRIAVLVENGLLSLRDERLQITERGLLVANEVILQLL